MNIKINLQRVWSVVAVLSLALLICLWFVESVSTSLLYTILALDALMILLALPVSVFALPVIYSAWHFLDLNPLTAEGVYLSTILLALLGTMQWFWLIRFYFPPDAPFQKLNLT